MKKYICTLTIVCSSTCLFAQHKLVKLWETDSTLKIPESVLHDAKNKILYVSNIDGEPWGNDNKGSVGKVDFNGKIVNAEWVKGLHAPKGLALYKNTLYVADLTEIAVINIKDGYITKKITVPGAAGLNDITVDDKGTIYVSDSKNKKIYSVKNETSAVLLDNLKGPNGVLFHKNILYVLDAGGMYKMQPDKTLVKITDGMEGGTDGIENVAGNDFLVSCWGGVLWYVNADGSKEKLLDTQEQKINAADIGYDAAHKIIYVPTFFKKSVTAYRLQ
jgi:hypothetical protein